MRLALQALLLAAGWSLLPAVHSHGYIATLRINDRTYVGNPFQNLEQTNANFSAVRLAPPDKGYTAIISDPHMACGLNGTASGPTAHYPVVAGDVVTMTMTLQDDVYPWPHQPCILSAWMALCPESPTACTNVDASTLDFFKISQDAVTDGLWPMQTLLHNTAFRTDGVGAGPEYYTVIPQDLASGNYLLRFETDCVFQLYADAVEETDLNPSDPMFYPWCVQINLTSNGTIIPPGIPMNTAYSPSEFSDLQNTTFSIDAWPVPGPPVVSMSLDAATRSFDNNPSTGYYNYNGSAWNHSSNDPNAYNSTISCSDDPLATYAFAFVGTGFSLLFGPAADRGQFKVTIDGADLGVVGSGNTVSGESPYTTQYHNSSLSLAAHTVVVSQGSQNVYLCNDLVQLQGGMLPASRLPVLLTPVAPLVGVSNNTQGSSSSSSSSSSSTTNVGAIAGATVGAIVVIVLVIVGVLWFRRQRKSRNTPKGPRMSLDGPQEEAKMMDSPSIHPMSAASPLQYQPNVSARLGSSVEDTPTASSSEAEYDGRQSSAGVLQGIPRSTSIVKRGMMDAAQRASTERNGLYPENRHPGVAATRTAAVPRSRPSGGRPLPPPPPPPAPSHAVDGGRVADWEATALPPLYQNAVSPGIRQPATPVSPVSEAGTSGWFP